MPLAARPFLIALVTCSLASPAFAGEGFAGKASYYATNYTGRVASGVKYDPAKFTCAHRTLPLGTKLKVSDNRTGKSVVVTVNDRGPFVRGRVLDLSLAAAKELGMTGRGVIVVRAEQL